MSAEAKPNRVPAIIASPRLRSRTDRPSESPAPTRHTAPAPTTDGIQWEKVLVSRPPSGWPTARKTASATAMAPAHARSVPRTGRAFQRELSGSANTSARIRRGCTTSIEPTASAAAWSR